MKYVITISQLVAILFLLLDLFAVVDIPELRVASYGVITLGLVFTLFLASKKSKA